MMVCVYCGTIQGDRLACCSEHDFVTADEYAIIAGDEYQREQIAGAQSDAAEDANIKEHAPK